MLINTLSNNMKRVLFSLFKDARKSYAEIGREIGRSRQNVSQIVERLEGEKIIWGYVPIVDVRKMGKKIFIVLIKYASNYTNNKIRKNIMDAARINVNHPDDSINFLNSSIVYGCFDSRIKLVANDIIDVKNFINSLKEKYPDYIDYTEILQEILPIRMSGIINPDIETDVKNILK